MNPQTQTELEAAAFRSLVKHLDSRTAQGTDTTKGQQGRQERQERQGQQG